jgi:hypothetical protein
VTVAAAVVAGSVLFILALLKAAGFEQLRP